MYIAYKSNRNFLYLVLQKQKLKLYFPFNIHIFNDDLKKIYLPPQGLQAAGFFSGVDLDSFDDLEYVANLVKQSYLQSV